MALGSADARRVGEALFGLITTAVRHTTRELSLTALSTLGTLERSGRRRITELAVIEGVTQPAMTGVVAVLESAGLAERARDDSDGRVVLVGATAAGLAYLRDRRREGARFLGDLIGKLPEEERETLFAAGPALLRLRDLDGETRVSETKRLGGRRS